MMTKATENKIEAARKKEKKYFKKLLGLLESFKDDGTYVGLGTEYTERDLYSFHEQFAGMLRAKEKFANMYSDYNVKEDEPN